MNRHITCILSLVLVLTMAIPFTPALAGENDGPVRNGLTAYQLAPHEAATLVFEFWLYDEEVVNISDYDLMVDLDGVPTDIRIATIQGYDRCVQVAQRYRATVLVHPGQVRVSNVRISGRQPYYVDDSLNSIVRIESGETQFVRQAVAESSLMTLQGYGKIRVGDKVLVSRNPPACDEPVRSGRYELATSSGWRSPYSSRSHREDNLCSSVSVPTAPARTVSGNHVWVRSGEQVTILGPDQTECVTHPLTGMGIATTASSPCQVEWHGPAVAGYQHGLECNSGEHVLCKSTGTSQLVSEPECQVVSDQPDEEDTAVAYRVTVGNESIAVAAGYTFTIRQDTTVAQLSTD